MTAELRRHEWGGQGEPHTEIGKKKKPLNEFSHGYHGQRYCLWARTHDDGDGNGDDGGGVAQDGGHTPNNRIGWDLIAGSFHV